MYSASDDEDYGTGSRGTSVAGDRVARACDACHRAKARCGGDGVHPCPACSRKGAPCVYSEAKKRGPKTGALKALQLEVLQLRAALAAQLEAANAAATEAGNGRGGGAKRPRRSSVLTEGYTPPAGGASGSATPSAASSGTRRLAYQPLALPYATFIPIPEEPRIASLPAETHFVRLFFLFSNAVCPLVCKSNFYHAALRLGCLDVICNICEDTTPVCDHSGRGGPGCAAMTFSVIPGASALPRPAGAGKGRRGRLVGGGPGRGADASAAGVAAAAEVAAAECEAAGRNTGAASAGGAPLSARLCGSGDIDKGGGAGSELSPSAGFDRRAAAPVASVVALGAGGVVDPSPSPAGFLPAAAFAVAASVATQPPQIEGATRPRLPPRYSRREPAPDVEHAIPILIDGQPVLRRAPGRDGAAAEDVEAAAAAAAAGGAGGAAVPSAQEKRQRRLSKASAAGKGAAAATTAGPSWGRRPEGKPPVIVPAGASLSGGSTTPHPACAADGPSPRNGMASGGGAASADEGDAASVASSASAADSPPASATPAPTFDADAPDSDRIPFVVTKDLMALHARQLPEGYRDPALATPKLLAAAKAMYYGVLAVGARLDFKFPQSEAYFARCRESLSLAFDEPCVETFSACLLMGFYTCCCAANGDFLRSKMYVSLANEMADGMETSAAAARRRQRVQGGGAGAGSAVAGVDAALYGSSNGGSSSSSSATGAATAAPGAGSGLGKKRRQPDGGGRAGDAPGDAGSSQQPPQSSSGAALTPRSTADADVSTFSIPVDLLLSARFLAQLTSSYRSGAGAAAVFAALVTNPDAVLSAVRNTAGDASSGQGSGGEGGGGGESGGRGGGSGSSGHATGGVGGGGEPTGVGAAAAAAAGAFAAGAGFPAFALGSGGPGGVSTIAGLPSSRGDASSDGFGGLAGAGASGTAEEWTTPRGRMSRLLSYVTMKTRRRISTTQELRALAPSLFALLDEAEGLVKAHGIGGTMSFMFLATVCASRAVVHSACGHGREAVLFAQRALALMDTDFRLFVDPIVASILVVLIPIAHGAGQGRLLERIMGVLRDTARMWPVGHLLLAKAERRLAYCSGGAAAGGGGSGGGAAGGDGSVEGGGGGGSCGGGEGAAGPSSTIGSVAGTGDRYAGGGGGAAVSARAGAPGAGGETRDVGSRAAALPTAAAAAVGGGVTGRRGAGRGGAAAASAAAAGGQYLPPAVSAAAASMLHAGGAGSICYGSSSAAPLASSSFVPALDGNPRGSGALTPLEQLAEVTEALTNGTLSPDGSARPPAGAPGLSGSRRSHRGLGPAGAGAAGGATSSTPLAAAAQGAGGPGGAAGGAAGGGADAGSGGDVISGFAAYPSAHGVLTHHQHPSGGGLPLPLPLGFNASGLRSLSIGSDPGPSPLLHSQWLPAPPEEPLPTLLLPSKSGASRFHSDAAGAAAAGDAGMGLGGAAGDDGSGLGACVDRSAAGGFSVGLGLHGSPLVAPVAGGVGFPVPPAPLEAGHGLSLLRMPRTTDVSSAADAARQAAAAVATAGGPFGPPSGPAAVRISGAAAALPARDSAGGAPYATAAAAGAAAAPPLGGSTRLRNAGGRANSIGVGGGPGVGVGRGPAPFPDLLGDDDSFFSFNVFGAGPLPSPFGSGYMPAPQAQRQHLQAQVQHLQAQGQQPPLQGVGAPGGAVAAASAAARGSAVHAGRAEPSTARNGPAPPAAAPLHVQATYAGTPSLAGLPAPL
jgi:hypothetical protein